VTADYQSDDRIDGVFLGLHPPSAGEPIGASLMPYKPNYRIERAERDRVKKAKKEEKIKQQQERAALRRVAERDDVPPDEPENP
jgi:hypothetical protein